MKSQDCMLKQLRHCCAGNYFQTSTSFDVQAEDEAEVSGVLTVMTVGMYFYLAFHEFD